MPSKFTCADCGGPVTSQQAPAKAAAMRCHPCRRLKRVKPCAYCGNTFVWPDSHPRKYCSKQCLSQSMQIRPPDDIRVRRIHREQAAPGLNPGQRYKLRDKRIAQGHKCAYCQAQADTIDHVVPLVRGGTNYEGNLVVCCRSCNSSKSGSTVMEWRTGRRLPRMTTAVVWPARPVRQHKAKPPSRTQLPYLRNTNHPNQVLHHRLRRRSPSPLHTRPIPHQSRAATPTTQTHQHRTLTTDTTT